jgi:peptidoglycan hydrolase-like protein with peptidoglycan-binding domain
MSDATEPTLRLGDQGRDGWVEYLQQLLNARSGLAVPTTGEFDAATHAAVINFQRGNHLVNGGPPLLVDGVVGNQTWAALRQEAPRAIGTDGLAPHAFQEQGPEARWFTEQGPPSFDPARDTLVIVAVNTGNVDFVQGTFPASGTITNDATGSVVNVTLTSATRGGQPAPPGDAFEYGVVGVSGLRLPIGTYTMVATMDPQLGGDQATFVVQVGDDPPPAQKPGSTEPEFGIRILAMDANADFVAYRAQAIGTRGGAGADILIWLTDDGAETEAVQEPFEIGPQGTYDRVVLTPPPVRARMNSVPGLGFSVELSTNAGAGGQGQIDRQSRTVPGFSGN